MEVLFGSWFDFVFIGHGVFMAIINIQAQSESLCRVWVLRTWTIYKIPIVLEFFARTKQISMATVAWKNKLRRLCICFPVVAGNLYIKTAFIEVRNSSVLSKHWATVFWVKGVWRYSKPGGFYTSCLRGYLSLHASCRFHTNYKMVSGWIYGGERSIHYRIHVDNIIITQFYSIICKLNSIHLKVRPGS